MKEIVPEAYAYLTGASVLSFTLPYCLNIAWKRACVIKRGAKKAGADDAEYTLTRLKEAEDAAIMGKMFDNMGRVTNAIKVSRSILTIFKVEGEYDWETGFNISEINSLGPKELEVMVSTMILIVQNAGGKSFNQNLATTKGKRQSHEL